MGQTGLSLDSLDISRRKSGSFWAQDVVLNCKTAPVVRELSEETNSSAENSSRP